MKPIAAVTLAATFLLAGCNVYRDATSARPDPTAPWRAVATGDDRQRLRNWRKAWTEALESVKAAAPEALAADPILFDPDRALPDAAIPPGKYRCRTYKLGAAGTAMRAFTAYPEYACAIVDEGDTDSFHKIDGSQRPVGRIYREVEARSVFLGTMILGDETSPLRYGLDEKRDMVGYVERIGDKRWRLALPYPHFESKLDVIDLVAAD
jgi:hypothetical protein